MDGAYLHALQSWKTIPYGVDHLSVYHREDVLNLQLSYINLSNDLGNVFVMKGLAQRGHSPRLYKCEEGTLHYPTHTHTLWADVGNAMYGYHE